MQRRTKQGRSHERTALDLAKGSTRITPLARLSYGRKQSAGRAPGRQHAELFCAYLAPPRGTRYDAAVFGIAGRRLAEGVVALFALLGFAFVPLGRKTALEHTKDIFTTPAALDAWGELSDATARLRDKLITTALAAKLGPKALDPSGATPEVPALPRNAHKPK
jgi:hypothetical protein